MLTPYQVELIHAEIDGENLPEGSVEVRKLVETQPEALALLTSLRSLDAMFGEVPDRVPSPRLIQLIHNAMPLHSRASPNVEDPQETTQTITSWINQQWNSVKTLMEDSMQTKKILIIATTAVAAIAIIGQAVTGYPPSVFDAGTIGAGDGMGGVQQAGRYKGRSMSKDDVTLSNPEIHALFQNDQVLKLVKSDVFREAMRNDAFRELQSSKAFRELMSSEANRELMSSEAYRELMSSEAYRELMSSEAAREVMANDASRAVNMSDLNRSVMNSEAYRSVMANDAYRTVMANDAYRSVMSNDAYQSVMANEAFRSVMSTDAYRNVMSNEAYRNVMANDAYRQLQSSDLFRAVSRTQSMSELFLNEAMRAQQ